MPRLLHHGERLTSLSRSRASQSCTCAKARIMHRDAQQFRNLPTPPRGLRPARKIDLVTSTCPQLPDSPAGFPKGTGDGAYCCYGRMDPAMKSDYPALRRADGRARVRASRRAAPFTIQTLFVGPPLARVLQKRSAHSTVNQLRLILPVD
jgi:hypothetical protein